MVVTCKNFAGWQYFLQAFAANLKPKFCHRISVLLAMFYERILRAVNVRIDIQKHIFAQSVYSIKSVDITVQHVN